MDIEEVRKEYNTFTSIVESVMLGTVDSDENPNVSYTPFVIDENKNIYIFISGMSVHTQNLHANGKASVMFVEDEKNTKQIFARRRLTYDCTASLMEKDDPQWNLIADKFAKRFGNIIDSLRSLSDFRIFQLTPSKGLFVIGFGAAYRINGENLNDIIHMTGNGHGHKSS
ncbi:MAG: pyridoxamine 5'-phosphate oxidase family protein [Cyanobacteria bacterium P01_D01_bin.116]